MSLITQYHKKALLIIFYRNPVLGKVKSRLAATVGNAKALHIYLTLADHTKSITQNLQVDRVVYYSDNVEDQDTWSDSLFQKKIQTGTDLGERMASAFLAGFTSGFESICIIGTDCFELTGAILEEGFNKLQTYGAVIGPARDGGYYLLGMNSFHREFFKNKIWSSDTVRKNTVSDFNTLGLSYYQLPVLTDVDEEKDLPDALKML